MNCEEFTIPEETEETSNVSLREELLSPAEKGEIKQSEKYIKKASQETLEKIKMQQTNTFPKILSQSSPIL